MLLPGVKVTLTIEKAQGRSADLALHGGLRDYLMQTLDGAIRVIPLFEGEHYAGNRDGEDFAEGEGAAWCVAFTEDGDAVRESYVNLIPTRAGGTHEAGLRDGLFDAVKSFVDMHALLPKGVKLHARGRVRARVASCSRRKVLDPQFQGQIKERLNSRDAVQLVSQLRPRPRSSCG